MDLTCCHGNRYDVISALKVLTNNRVAKIFIVCLHNEISFFGIFHRFTNTIARKKPFRASLTGIFLFTVLWSTITNFKILREGVQGENVVKHSLV